MAITRTQQARQMLKKGSEPVVQGGVDNYLGKQPQVVVPRKWQSGPDKPPTELAYITEAEKKLLLKEDIHGSLKEGPNEGPGGVMSLDSFGDIGGAGAAGVDTDPGGGYDTGPGGGGFTGKGPNESPADFKARQAKETAALNKAVKDQEERAKEMRKDARATRKKMSDLKKRDRFVRQERIKGILAGKKSFTYTDPITGRVVTSDLNPAGLTDTELAELEALGLDPAFQGPMTPSQQIAFNNFIEKSDKFSGVNLETFQNRFDLPKTGITSVDLIANLLKGPLKAGAKKNREFFSDPNYMGLFGKKKPSVLEAGKFTYAGLPVDPTVFGRLGTAEMEEIYGNYMDKRMGGEIDAYGNPTPTTDEDKGGPSDPCLGPNPPAYCFIGQRAATPPEDPIFTPAFRFMIRGGMVEDAPMGGIMDLETTRQMLFIGGVAKAIGKGVKSVTRGLKKVAKSPLGKAALLGAVGFGIPGTGFGGLFGRASFGGPALGAFGKFGIGPTLFANPTIAAMKTQGLEKGFFPKFFGNMTGLKVAGLSGLAGALLSNVGKDDDNDFNIEEYYKMAGIDIPENQYRFLAEGGSTEKEPVAKKTMPLLDLEGQEMDFRQDGGFVPIGRMEKADDVPARLSKNEFVFTAEAVRNAGGGDVDKGAEVMYNTMKNLEAGGEVSEETQGLEGARKMFQTSQRLGEVV